MLSTAEPPVATIVEVPAAEAVPTKLIAAVDVAAEKTAALSPVVKVAPTCVAVAVMAPPAVTAAARVLAAAS